MFIVSQHIFLTIVGHHTSRVIVVHVWKTVVDDKLIFVFVEEIREVSFGQLEKIKGLWNFRESHWNEIHRVDELHFQVRHIYAPEIRSIHDHSGKMDSSFSSEKSHLQKSSRVFGPLNIRSLYCHMLQKLFWSNSSSSMHSSHTFCTTYKLGTCRMEPQDGL